MWLDVDTDDTIKKKSRADNGGVAGVDVEVEAFNAEVTTATSTRGTGTAASGHPFEQPVRRDPLVSVAYTDSYYKDGTRTFDRHAKNVRTAPSATQRVRKKVTLSMDLAGYMLTSLQLTAPSSANAFGGMRTNAGVPNGTPSGSDMSTYDLVQAVSTYLYDAFEVRSMLVEGGVGSSAGTDGHGSHEV
jgi:hypothetical protein